MTDDEQIAERLECEVPWETCSKVLSHTGWLDLLETIKLVSPDAYAMLRRDIVRRPLRQTHHA